MDLVMSQQLYWWCTSFRLCCLLIDVVVCVQLQITAPGHPGLVMHSQFPSVGWSDQVKCKNVRDMLSKSIDVHYSCGKVIQTYSYLNAQAERTKKSSPSLLSYNSSLASSTSLVHFFALVRAAWTVRTCRASNPRLTCSVCNLHGDIPRPSVSRQWASSAAKLQRVDHFLPYINRQYQKLTNSTCVGWFLSFPLIIPSVFQKKKRGISIWIMNRYNHPEKYFINIKLKRKHSIVGHHWCMHPCLDF